VQPPGFYKLCIFASKNPVRRRPEVRRPPFFFIDYRVRTMSRQLTPEEIGIIRRTEREGAELAAQETGRDRRHGSLRRIVGILVFAAVFIVFACIAYIVVSATLR